MVENILFLVAIGAILIVVTLLIGLPFLKPEKHYLLDSKPLVFEEIERDKEAILTTLNEIEFDYKMNKLAEDDYIMLRNKYRQVALDILKEEEDETLQLHLEKQGVDITDLAEVEAEIEAELSQLEVKQ